MRTWPAPGLGTGRVLTVNGVAAAERRRAVWVCGMVVDIVLLLLLSVLGWMDGDETLKCSVR